METLKIEGKGTTRNFLRVKWQKTILWAFGPLGLFCAVEVSFILVLKLKYFEGNQTDFIGKGCSVICCSEVISVCQIFYQFSNFEISQKNTVFEGVGKNRWMGD